MAFFYTELFIKNSPFTLTTAQLYDVLNDKLDNGILLIVENIELTPRGRRKTFTIRATCKIHNPIFKTVDVGDHLILYLVHNGKKQKLKMTFTIPDHS